jgi:predicted PurR-regulated permease PerM
VLTRWIIGAIVVVGLYAGRPVLIPVALAILLSFILAPAVELLRRLRIARTPAVLIVVAFSLGTIVATSTVIFSQAATLSADAPAYAERITGKIGKLRATIDRRFSFLTRESSGGSGHYKARDARRSGRSALPRTTGFDAIPVEVHDPPPTAIQSLANMIAPAFAPLQTMVIVVVLAIFILFQRYDLRDRLIRLLGAADLHRTTIALDDGAARLSRYFLSQFAVNCAFGAVIWAGLFLIGVPSPGLWGIIAGLLRFVPYVGSLIAIVGPLALATAVDPGWAMVGAVAALFAGVEAVVGYVLEPLLYGRSSGLSPVSVVIAAIFWTWIWGPIGLILSMPLTLMLVALGRHIPAFAFFDIAFGDRPALTPQEAFYQRLIMGRVEQVLDQAEDLLTEMPIDSYYDEVMLGGLRLTADDLDRGLIDHLTLTRIIGAATDVVETLTHHVDPERVSEADSAEDLSAAKGRSVLCIQGRGPFDGIVTGILADMLHRHGYSVRTREWGGLHHFTAEKFDVEGADAICVAGLFDERSQRRVAGLLRRLRTALQPVPILLAVGRSDPALQSGEDRPFANFTDFLTSLKIPENAEHFAA